MVGEMRTAGHSPSRFQLLSGAHLALTVLWGLGQIGRDRTWLTGVCFYLPSPEVAGLGLLVFAILLRLRSRRLAALSLVLALPPIVLTLAFENTLRRPGAIRPRGARAQPVVVRLVHWNVARGRLGWEDALRDLRARPADVYVLSEAPPNRDWSREAKAWGADWQAVSAHEGVVLARGRLSPGLLRATRGSWAWPVEWTDGSIALRLLVVDLTPRLSVARRPLLDWIADQVSRLRPDVIVGDFNTPRRAYGLSPLSPGYRHAYDLAGSGWSYTWPVPLPLIAIDQCFVARRIGVRRYALDSTLHSDHRLQLVELEVPPTIEP
jgi:vancomycin resistance protein VanJ